MNDENAHDETTEDSSQAFRVQIYNILDMLISQLS